MPPYIMSNGSIIDDETYNATKGFLEGKARYITPEEAGRIKSKPKRKTSDYHALTRRVGSGENGMIFTSFTEKGSKALDSCF